jgi:hypothetical protein
VDRYGDDPELRHCAAKALCNKGFALQRLRRSQDAVWAFGQAVERFGDLPELRDEVARAVEGAWRRVIRGVRLAGDGDRSEAADVMNEAVEIYRRVAHTNPDAVDRELGGVLRDLLDLPSGTARQNKALAYTSLMVKIVRPVALVNRAWIFASPRC